MKKFTIKALLLSLLLLCTPNNTKCVPGGVILAPFVWVAGGVAVGIIGVAGTATFFFCKMVSNRISKRNNPSIRGKKPLLQSSLRLRRTGRMIGKNPTIRSKEVPRTVEKKKRKKHNNTKSRAKKKEKLKVTICKKIS